MVREGVGGEEPSEALRCPYISAPRSVGADARMV